LNFFVMSKPPILTSPPVGSVSFVRDLNVVVFPAPFTPSNTKHSPKSSPNEAFLTARILLSPYL
jgi:hypothetical protein